MFGIDEVESSEKVNACFLTFRDYLFLLRSSSSFQIL